jgi:hypothetical protein
MQSKIAIHAYYALYDINLQYMFVIYLFYYAFTFIWPFYIKIIMHKKIVIYTYIWAWYSCAGVMVIGSSEVCVQEIIVNVGDVFMRFSFYCEVCPTESYYSWTSFITCSLYLLSRPLSGDGGSCDWTICTSRLVIKKKST